MKNFIKITLFLLFIGMLCINVPNLQAMPNPWTNCGDSFECATKVSGITFPLRLSNYQIRAMKNMIEVSYPLDEFRDVVVRKTDKYLSDDISGVYTKYPINRKMRLKNGVLLDTKGTFFKIYVMNMGAESGYYSAYCEKGMSKKEVQGVYNVIRDAEAPKLEKYSNCELGDIVGDDVKGFNYKDFWIYYHTNDFSKKQMKQFANECIKEGVYTQWDMDCCTRFKMFPVD